MRYFVKLGGALCVVLAASANADIPTDLTAAEDPRANLQRLIGVMLVLRAADAAGGGNLTDVLTNLDAAADRQRIRNSLRSLLPDVTRHHTIRERVGAQRKPRKTRFRPRQSRASQQSRSYRFGAHLSPFRDTSPSSNSGGLTWLTSTSAFQPSTDVWMQLWTDEGSQDDEDGFDGFESDSIGFSLGMDHRLTEDLSFSVSVGSQSGDVTSTQFGHDDLSADEFGLGFAYNKGAHTVDFSIARSMNETNRDRVVLIDTDAGRREFVLVSNIDARQTGFSLGYSGYVAGSNIALVPFVSTTWAKLETDDYFESGGGALNLLVETEDEAQWLGTIGASVSWAFFTDRWLISPHVGVSFEHDFKSDATSTLSRFRGTAIAFRTTGFAIEENRWRYSAGLQLLHTSAISIGLSYDGQRKGNYAYDAAILSVQLQL